MKKKTKSKSRNSFLFPFTIAITVCFFGIAINSFLFYGSFFRALTKLNEEPIATITFKYKTAQRKFLEKVVWDRLRENSPVYDGDTIHTSNLAEATIHFIDGNIMELSENTMAQVFLSKDKSLRAELAGGVAVVDSSGSEHGMTLSSGGTETVLAAGTSVSAKTTPVKSVMEFMERIGKKSSASAESGQEEIALQVLKGNATVRSENKGEISIGEGEGIVVSREEELKPSFIVTEPAVNAKLLYHTEGEAKVPFKWNLSNVSEGSGIKISVSPEKNFSEIIAETTVENSSQTELNLGAGNYYWKASMAGGKDGTDVSETQEISGRIKVIQSLSPSLIAPVSGFEYTYRTKMPAVRLIWTESPLASAYKIEISKNADFSSTELELRSSLTSSIISTLQDGTYYWRVTPFYSVNKEGFTTPSNTGSFAIVQKGSLNSPEIYVPADNAFVNIEQGAKNSYFSWRQETEAAKYSIVIADNPELSHPKLNEETSDNYITFNAARRNFTEGKWYWAVGYVDGEGNTSPPSEVRSFYAMNGEPEQHTIEPVDGYSSSESLVRDTKFTWKRNLTETFKSEIQFSTTEDFTNIVYRSEIAPNSNSIGGLTFSTGTYYWRLKSVSDINEITMLTPPKKFRVLENFPAPVMLAPLEKAVTRENRPYEFKWEEIPEADFYKFAIFNEADGTLMYEDNVWGTSVELDMFKGRDFIEKSYYRWQVQAQANAVPGISTRRTGKLAEDVFYLVKLRPVEVEFPAKNARIDGAEAIINPITARWSSVDNLARSQFVLRRTNVSPSEVVLKVPTDKEMRNGTVNAPFEVLLDVADGLRAGTYEIVIYAETLDGIDVSNSEAKNRGRFTIKEVEPLPAASNLVAKPALFNADYLRMPQNPKSITLSWDKVSAATDYYVTIRTKAGKVLLRKNVTNGTSYAIEFTKLSPEDKAVFSNGTFNWRVEAVRRIDTNKDGKPDKILQGGRISESYFETDIPTPKQIQAKGASNPYGN